ncbi:hypothetical protein D3C77_568100 [compost metagenome]
MAIKYSKLHPLQLKMYFSIPEVLLDLNITHITSAMNDTQSPKAMDILFKHLHSMDIYKIGGLMNKTLEELEDGGIQNKSQQLLLELLKLIEENPNIITAYQLLDQNKNLWC